MIIKSIKKVFVEIERWLDEPYVFINTMVAMTLIGIGMVIGYLLFAPI